MSGARGRIGACATCVLAAVSAPASASESLNSSETPGATTQQSAATEGHNDFTIAPVFGGSTDIGIGGGFVASMTRNQKGYTPYAWNIESAGFTSVDMPNEKFELPYIDWYAKLTVNRFLRMPLQLEVRPSYTDEERLYYFGMGNASMARPPPGRTLSYFQYARIHPSLVADLLFKIVDHWSGKTGVRYTGTWLNIAPGTRLSDDIRSGSPEVKSLIGTTTPQSVVLFRYGIRFDTRDNEVSPHLGTFDEAELKWSPGGTNELPFRYAEASLILRGYVPVFSPRVTLAARVVGDVLLGQPPFYELSRFEDTYAVGGSSGVRGVPAQRYYGRVKVFGNVEVRGKVIDFAVFKKAMTAGVAVFFDGGRVWADTTPHPELDGNGLGVKYGIGGGLRLLSGTAFLLRADLAWSPDAMPLGGYIAAGEMF